MGKQLVIWVDGDYDLKRHLENAIYIKNASYKSLNIKNEIIRPGDVPSDLLMEYFNGEFELREKTDRPTIGFVGLAKTNFLKLIYLILRNFFEHVLSICNIRKFAPPRLVPWFVFREKVIKVLNNSNLKCNFILRTRFAVGVKNGNPKQRLEFINNIMDSDYILCIRGASNYSIRFYEALCLGRIPILIDTDCKLPLEHLIDWDSIVLRINCRDINSIEKLILEFHKSLTNEEFNNRQLRCRETWLNFLSKSSFPQHLFS